METNFCNLRFEKSPPPKPMYNVYPWYCIINHHHFARLVKYIINNLPFCWERVWVWRRRRAEFGEAAARRPPSSVQCSPCAAESGWIGWTVHFPRAQKCCKTKVLNNYLAFHLWLKCNLTNIKEVDLLSIYFIPVQALWIKCTSTIFKRSICYFYIQAT